MITRWLPDDYEVITRWLRDDYEMITRWLRDDYEMIARWLKDDYEIWYRLNKTLIIYGIILIQTTKHKRKSDNGITIKKRKEKSDKTIFRWWLLFSSFSSLL